MSLPPINPMTDMMLQRIDIGTLKDQFIGGVITPNERAYDEKVKIHNNNYLQRWHDEFLKDFADEDNMVVIKKGMELWDVWNQGQEIRGVMRVIASIPETPKEVIDSWKKLFSLPIEELLKLERPAIANGYHILQQYYSMWVMKEKYEKVFKEAPIMWYDLYKQHQLLFQRKIEPFSIDDYKAKLNAIMTNGIYLKR